VQQDRPHHADAFEHGGDVLRLCNGWRQVLDVDLDQDAKHPVVIGQRHEALGIGHTGKPRLDADAAPAQKLHHCRRVRFRKIDRCVVGQFTPAVDRLAGPLRVVLDPRSGRYADQRAGAGPADGQHGGIDGPQAFEPVRIARMNVQFGRAGGDAGRGVAGHGLRVERQPGMEFARPRAVDAGLDDHGFTLGLEQA
jgi:hypothetical protein